MKAAKFKRMQDLKVFIKQMEGYKEFCVASQDFMRYENACLGIGEAKQELRTLRAQLRK